MSALAASRARFARFVAVGASAALMLFALAWALAALGLPAFAAAALGYAAAFAFAYTAQRSWTFGGAHSHRRALPRYLAAQLGCVVAAGAVGHVSAEVLAAPPLWMSLAVTATAGATSYLLSSLWVFADTGAG